MKLSKSLLHAILVAVTAGTISSCEKLNVDDGKKTSTETPKTGIPEGCPACGMG